MIAASDSTIGTFMAGSWTSSAAIRHVPRADPRGMSPTPGWGSVGFFRPKGKGLPVRQMHFQHTIFKVRIYFGAICTFRKCETSHERTVGTFDPMVFFVLFFF